MKGVSLHIDDIIIWGRTEREHDERSKRVVDVAQRNEKTLFVCPSLLQILMIQLQKKVVWKHLLNVYPEGMTGRERMDYIKKKALEYVSLKETWKTAIAQGPVVGELAYTTGMVRKDVLRTDRHHPFYAGSDDNQNIASLFNILTTYALNHPKVSYCQGMSDLASPLLVTMNDEAHAYICFCALMQRLCTNFMIDGIAMTQKFTHLAEGIMYYDQEFYNYLKLNQADDLLFCYRWLLLEMKREFAFEDSLRMLEVLWSSLPADPPEKELKLFDTLFQFPAISTPPSPLVKMTRETQYTKICALRRQSSSISLCNYKYKENNQMKRQNHSLDESINKSKNNIFDMKLRHQSLDDTALSRSKSISIETSPEFPQNCVDFSHFSKKNSLLLTSPKSELRSRSVSPLESKSDSVVLNNRLNKQQLLAKKSASLSSSMTNLINSTKRSGHFNELKDKKATAELFSSLDRLDTIQSIKEEEERAPKAKLVKNLNEFLKIGSASKNKISDVNVEAATEKPKIMLTKSSFDESESSNLDHNSSGTRLFSSTSNDETFDDTSPDDSQEYFPLTTSVTTELSLELENLNRTVFGDKLIKRLCESPSNEDVEAESETLTNEFEFRDNSNDKRKSDDVFVWENPLHLTSPSKAVNITTHHPDRQFGIENDAPTMVNETLAMKIVTPIRIINQTSIGKVESVLEEPETGSALSNPTTFPNHLMLNVENPTMTNSCEEVTESKSSTLLPPPNEFGGGNPFLMFLCITLLLQHRDHIINKAMDYNEMAMHFDKMVRKHNVIRVLNQARQLYARYIKQQSISQQRI